MDEPREIQRQRARETGRGRHADAPWQIPWAGWMDILVRVYGEVGEDRLLAVAAGVVFYGLLALFPAITALVSIYGFFTDPSEINAQLSFLAGVVPDAAYQIISAQVQRISQTGNFQLGFGFVFGLAVALWGANAGMKAIMDALNVVYEEEEKRSFIRLTLVAFAFTLGAIASLSVAVAAVVVLPLVAAAFGLQNTMTAVLNVLRWPALLTIILLGLALLYRFGPSRDHARWQWISPGSLLAAIVGLVASVLLSWYLGNFAHYGATYGSLGGAVGLMMWMWVSAIVVLVGAELNAEVEHQTACDSTVGPRAPLGKRGAAMADTVGVSRR